MQKLLTRTARVERFLRRQAKNPAFDFSEAPDPRQQAKVTHSIASVIRCFFGGLLANRPTLRAVESHCGTGGPVDSSRPISDTTLHGMAPRLCDRFLLSKLVQQVKWMLRKKMIKNDGLPVSVVAIDGKNQGTLRHDGDGRGHHRSSASAEKWQAQCHDDDGHYVAPVLRATLVSSVQRLAMSQMPVPPQTGEAAAFGGFLRELDAAYGRTGLLDVISADAGLGSLENATAVHAAHLTYVFGLKGNQQTLHDMAVVLLNDKAKTHAPEARTDWERAHGTEIRRELWRTREIAGAETTAGEWYHLQEAWLVRQSTRAPTGHVTVEDRYFITNIAPGRLRPQQILAVIRAHWRIENDTFNSLDVQWREDSVPWCRNGSAPWAISVLRLMAYNLAQHLRRCHLRERTGIRADTDVLRWRDLFDAIGAMMLTVASRAHPPGAAPS